MRIAVIGSGIGGLGTALLLAKAGHSVTIHEKNEVLGGRAGVFKADGFTFDMGPSWYLMPDVFEHFFKSMDENVHDHLDLVRLDPSYQVFFEGDARPVQVPASAVEAEKVIERLEKGGGEKFRVYLSKVAAQYKMVLEKFLYREYRTPQSMLTLDGLKAIGTLPLFGSIDSYLKKFFTSKKVRQLLEYSMVFLGSSPYNAPALYAMMSHVDFGLGVYYPQGGIYKLIEAFENIGKKYGVRYIVNSEVCSIEIQNGMAKALIFKNESAEQREEYDLIVSNSDLHHTETKLIPSAYQTYPEAYWENKILAPSAVLVYMGVRGKIDHLKHHNLYFAEAWEKQFDVIFKKPMWPENPSFYLCNPSKTDPSVAPEGYENLFLLVPVAARFGTAEESTAYAEQCIDHVAKTMNIPDLRQRIVFKRIFRPDEFASRYNSIGGTALGLAHTFSQTAFLRPQNKSKKISNLYYVGAAVHPGIGMPVCLVSAELVAKRILAEQT
jgi:phytoene desaturase